MPGGTVKITAEQVASGIKVTIVDTGVGISKDDQKKIFNKFFRSASVLKFSPDGTGLGLFITKALVAAMGGKISFSSEENKGTTFYFTLPLKM